MSAKPDEPSFTPRYPTLIAIGLLAVWVVVLCFPMFSGQFLGGHMSDQTWTGIPFRSFWAEEFRRTGGIPLWNPYMFGGLPFVGAMHGDTFYPTSFLRIFLSADTVLNLTFASHLLLAGVFTYAFLRTLGTTWAGAVVGGLAYQLSGIVASLVSPGHDGKMIVSALLPLLLTGLLLGIRKRRIEGYALVALVVGCDILSPQVQMAQYSLICAGLFTLYLVFMDEAGPRGRDRWMAMGLATAAVALGFGISMIQIYPFVQNGPYSARTAGVQGWDYATSYAMPVASIADWLIATFSGSHENFWAGGWYKLHSEYVGAGVIALAAVGIPSPNRRKLVLFLAGVFLLFLLVCLGPHTPFYKLWYAVVPGVKVTRAPGMAFFIPTFIFACWAAFGVERIERREGLKVLWGVLIGAGLLLLIGAAGGIVDIAERLAGEAYTVVQRSAGLITRGAVLSAIFAGVTAGIGVAAVKGKLRGLPLALSLAAAVSLDLFISVRAYFVWSPPAARLYARDEVLSHLEHIPLPYRVLDLPTQAGQAYPTAFLMYHRIPNAIGHHGNELHAWDELLGGKNEWTNLGSQRLWNLLAIRYLLLPIRLPIIGGYHVVASTSAPAAEGIRRQVPEVFLYEADSTPPYARVLAAAAKVPEAQIVPVLMDARFDYNRVLLLPQDAPVDLPRIDTLPPPSRSRAVVTAWEPGAMTVRIDSAPTAGSWLLVSENWYPEWQAMVDGTPVTPLRGDGSLLSVPLPAGAKEVRFTFGRGFYNRGKALSLASLAVLGVWFVVPPVMRRRRRV